MALRYQHKIDDKKTCYIHVLSFGSVLEFPGRIELRFTPTPLHALAAFTPCRHTQKSWIKTVGPEIMYDSLSNPLRKTLGSRSKRQTEWQQQTCWCLWVFSLWSSLPAWCLSNLTLSLTLTLSFDKNPPFPHFGARTLTSSGSSLKWRFSHLEKLTLTLTLTNLDKLFLVNESGQGTMILLDISVFVFFRQRERGMDYSFPPKKAKAETSGNIIVCCLLSSKTQ